MSFYKIIKSFLIIFLAFVMLNNCTKPDFSKRKKPIEPNAQKRAQQNVKDGKGLQIFKKKNQRGNGNFLFASSNPMWKAALETLSFISLANVDYAGGVIITDWYTEGNPDESIKITIKFLSNEIRSDGMLINLYKRNCVNQSCSTIELKDNLVFEIKDKILKKAIFYKEEDDKIADKEKPVKIYKGDNN